MGAKAETRDIVVIGASAGGVESLRSLVWHLPSGLRATVFVVLHLATGATSVLPQILTRAGALPASHPKDGERHEHGRIYVAPPDHHLLINDGTMELATGPKENGYRPAIDPLFRSAAEWYGRRTVGVVLSGVLDDGSAGLRTIGMAGGTMCVQTPADALYPGMPESAIAYAHPQHVMPISELGPFLVELVGRPVDNGDKPMRDNPHSANPGESHNPGHAQTPAPADENTPPGELTALVCPECGGSIWMNYEGGLPRYHCHVGHVYSEASFVAQHGEALENALWTSLRTLQERAALARRLSERMRERGHARAARRFEGQAEDALANARVINGVLDELAPMATPEEAAAEGD